MPRSSTVPDMSIITASVFLLIGTDSGPPALPA